MAFEDDIAEMRTETTERAIEFISSNKKLSERLRMAQERSGSTRSQGKWLKDQATMYANAHNGNFGELFVQELDLVKWGEVILNATN